MSETLRQTLTRLFWSVRYHIYNRDLYAALRADRGSKENPLTIEDLKPVFQMLRRLNPAASQVPSPSPGNTSSKI